MWVQDLRAPAYDEFPDLHVNVSESETSHEHRVYPASLHAALIRCDTRDLLQGQPEESLRPSAKALAAGQNGLLASSAAIIIHGQLGSSIG